MKQEELISIVIPVYNIESYLPRCLESVTNQTYRNLEIILVDDGSKDSSGILCDKYAEKDSRIKVIHQKNQGVGAARFKGQATSHGQFIMHIDGDDYIHKDMVLTLHQAITSGEDYDMAIGGRVKTNKMDEDTTSDLGELRTEELDKHSLVKNTLTHKELDIFSCVWNKLYRRRVVEEMTANKYRRYEDVDFNLQVAQRLRKAIWVKNCMYFYVQRPGSLVHSPILPDEELILPDILHSHYISQLSNNKAIKELLLRRLYVCMVAAKNRICHTNEYQRLKANLREYEKDTIVAYWLSKDISFWEKTSMTTLLHIPKLVKFIKDRIRPGSYAALLKKLTR